MTIEHFIGLVAGTLALFSLWWIAAPASALAFYSKLHRRPMRLTPSQVRIRGLAAFAIGALFFVRYGLHSA